MAGMDYLDFDLLIERAEECYRARALNSPAGQATSSFRLPFAADDLSGLLAGLMPGRDQTPGADADPPRDFGARLFDAVFADAVGSLWARSRDAAERQEAGLRLRLRLSDVPELAALPWELLYDTARAGFLALSSTTPVMRYLDLAEPARALDVTPPLHVVALASSPAGYPPLDIEREWSLLAAALGSAEARGLVVLERLQPPTLGALQRRLRQGECHVLHFIGHGAYDPGAEDGLLVLNDEAGAGAARLLTARDLVARLADHRALRLVVLNACEGAHVSTTNAFAGAAGTLVQGRIPAVVAMQFTISDQAAADFAAEFYAALADGYPVDAAVAEGRKAIDGARAAGAAPDWATPVLYMRAADGRIFELASLSEEEQAANRAAALWRSAQAAAAAADWPAAAARLQELLALEPGYPQAAASLEQARRQAELGELFLRGQEHYDAGRWREALDYFRRAAEIGGNYRGVYGLIATAQHAILQAERAAGKPAQPAAPGPAPGAVLPAGPPGPLDAHYRTVVKAILDGRVVPFLGAGANLCGRPPSLPWQRGQYLPTAAELAGYLADHFDYPAETAPDLVRVSEYVALMTGSGPLYDELHTVLDANYPPTPLHQLLAGLPGSLRRLGYGVRYQLIVTTNYDDVLEATFKAAGEPYDLVSYVAEGEQRGKFVHTPPDGEPRVIEVPNEYRALSPDERTVILKLHGEIDRANPERDSFMITEDHYIEYLSRSDLSNYIPVTLAARLRKSHFLFLGYSLQDWNLRVILHRIWGTQKLTYQSWAVAVDPQPIEREFWRKRDVDVLDVRLEAYVAALSDRLAALAPARGGSA